MNAHEIVATATRLLVDTGQTATPWIRVNEAAKRARCGVKLLYREIRAGRLHAARVGGRRSDLDSQRHVSRTEGLQSDSRQGRTTPSWSPPNAAHLLVVAVASWRADDIRQRSDGAQGFGDHVAGLRALAAGLDVSERR